MAHRGKRLWRVILLGAAAALAWADAASAAFDFEDVAEKAARVAAEPFREASPRVPDWLREIPADAWQDIAFRDEHALWRKRGLPFEVRFFHPGFIYVGTVQVNEVDAEGVHPVPFSPSQFDYGENPFAARVPQDLGYAGFQLDGPLRNPERKDPVLVFLGASYYRAVGWDQVFGLSARGLAIDTGLASGEEFPVFREFWIVRPTRAAEGVRIFALLDSRRIAGAYRFVVLPGRQTVVEVKARLFPREKIEKLGIAPLTSMFLFGENTIARPVDYRPEVHSSDGLLIAGQDDEWIWRPLMNPERLRIRRMGPSRIAGFGLMQRDRAFDHYQQFDPRLDLRPSAWVETGEGWGEGAVELVEIPSRSEENLNIVAYWVPAQPVQPGTPLSFSYTTYWYGDDPTRPPAGRVSATRPAGGSRDGARRFVVDFAGGRLERLSPDRVLRAVLTAGDRTEERLEVLEQRVEKNPVTGGWRLKLQVRPKTDGPLDLSVHLEEGGGRLTETWTHGMRP